jgi:hypothetical protein
LVVLGLSPEIGIDMVNIRELRVGNLVLYRGEEMLVCDIIGTAGQSLVLVASPEVQGGYFQETDPERVFPTPLTTKWLVKLGFFPDNQDCDVYQHENRHHIYVLENKMAYRVPGTTLLDIGHVHQLQNLYFALTGEELL